LKSLLTANVWDALLLLISSRNLLLWGAFAKLQKEAVSFIMSVRQSAWNSQFPLDEL
jgi:hypothetical protein